jgi:hypothetical protein
MSGRRVAVGVVVALAIAFAGWRALSLGVAERLARGDPATALRWLPGHAHAAFRAAEQGLRSGDGEHATALARAALHGDPLDGRPYRVLAQEALVRGEQATARRLAETAVVRAPRDLPARLLLERDYLVNGRVADALRQAEMLLRVEPKSLPKQFPLLQSLAGVPQAQPAFAEMLARRPPWRPLFLQMLADKGDDSRALAPLMQLLLRAPGGLSAFEHAAWIERLVNDRRYGEAWLSWVGALPPERQRDLANVVDGGFEREPGLLGFDWRFEPVDGAVIERAPAPGSEGQALGVFFEDRKIPFANVRQLLALPPGPYRLQGRERADGLRSTPGLVWLVACAEDKRELVRTPALRGVVAWRAFDVAFEVPAHDCAGQWLMLVSPARIAAEQRIGGRAWFDDLHVRRDDTAASIRPAGPERAGLGG